MTFQLPTGSRDRGALSSEERAELQLLRRLVDAACDVELKNGLWLERHGQTWNVYRNAQAIAVGVTIEKAIEVTCGGTNG